jgi:hypothetical protein
MSTIVYPSALAYGVELTMKRWLGESRISPSHGKKE